MCNTCNSAILKRNSLKRNLRTSQNFAKILRGGQCLKENPLNEICENLKILLKKVRGVQFYKRNPFKQNFRKSQNFAQKVKGGQFYKKKSL